ncbi:MAG: substrate-binding domain-containing protein [Lentisphaeria bacterium]|mgnify:FL=1
MITIKEIADALNFSTTTVSVCLSGRENDPRYRIRAENAELIRSFARKHGYVPDLSARRLRRSGGGTPPVGIVFSHRSGFEKSFPAIRHAMDTLAAHGREYVVLGYHLSHLAQALSTLRGLRVEDVILFGPYNEPCPVNSSSSMERSSPKASQKVDAWLADHENCRLLLKHMRMYVTDYSFPRPLDGGIQEGILRMGANSSEFVPKLLGKIKACGLGPVATVLWNGKEKELVPEILDSEELIFTIGHDGNRYKEGRMLADRVLKMREKHYFRSIFIANDGVAAGLITEVYERGLSVPDDIAVLGWGNDEPSECCRVPLSTFNSHVQTYAEMAIEAILKKKKIKKDICREFDYVERKSFVFPAEIAKQLKSETKAKA